MSRCAGSAGPGVIPLQARGFTRHTIFHWLYILSANLKICGLEEKPALHANGIHVSTMHHIIITMNIDLPWDVASYYSFRVTGVFDMGSLP